MKTYRLLSLILISGFATTILAEEENKEKIILTAKKISVKSVGTYGGFVTGIMSGVILGSSIIQDNEAVKISGAKIVTCALIGATCGTIAGKNIGHKYIEYYYPDK